MVAALGLAILIASATVAFAIGQSVRSGHAAQAAEGDQKSFSGVVTDSRCGARHQDSTKSPAECSQMCVRNGSSYVLVDGDKTYVLAGNVNEVSKLAGQRVLVSGTLDGDTLRIGSVHSQQ